MGEAKRRGTTGAATPAKAGNLTCFELTADPVQIRPAPSTRQWMDDTQEGFAYRCLPLNIANAHGWEVLNPAPFTAEWQGSTAHDGITVTPLSDKPVLAMSHFGSGVLTFHVSALFRTDPGMNLWVSGPTNLPKHGIQALTGVIETDWSVATFTMNWLFTAPGKVTFEEGEPFCFFFPVPRGTLEPMQPRQEPLATREHRPMYDEYVAWRNQRAQFLVDLKVPGTEANKVGWEKTYFQGTRPNGTQGTPDHQTRLRLRPFTVRRS